jgi:hypothetical protein
MSLEFICQVLFDLSKLLANSAAVAGQISWVLSKSSILGFAYSFSMRAFCGVRRNDFV